MIAPDKAPYPGLRPFERDESHLFFGRDDCVDAMIERLARTRFLAVLGSSGTGKSSLVKTGLLAGLEMGLLQGGGSRWCIVEFSPGGSPFANLAQKLLEAEGSGQDQPADPAEVERLQTHLARGGPRALIEWCRAGHLAPGTNLLLLVDQFEELFRYQDYDGRDGAEAFVSLLLESRRPIEVESPQMAEFPIYVTLTMRSEYLGACALIEGLAEAINEGTYLTPRLTRQQCEEAIVGPARVCGVEIDDRLVTRILNDLANFAPWEEGGSGDQLNRLARRADQLPLMQHALNQMWQRAKKKQIAGTKIKLTADDYHGLKQELDEHAKQVLRDLGETLRPVAEAIFRAVTSGTTVANAVRRPTKYGDLVEICGGDAMRPAVAEVVAAFGPRGCHFLTSDIRQTGAQLPDRAMIDISHESLIRQWEDLSAWLESEGRAAHDWQRLDEEAKQYKATDRAHRGALLSGVRLANAKTLREETKPTPVWATLHGIDLERVNSFIDKSVWAGRGWWAVKGLIACVGVVVAVYLANLLAENEREKALSVQLNGANAQLGEQVHRNEGFRMAVLNQGREIEKLAVDLIQSYRESRQEMMGGANSQNANLDERLKALQARSKDLAGLFSAVERTLSQARDNEPNNADLIRPHLITLALLSVLRSDPYSDDAKRQRQLAYGLADRLAASPNEMHLDFEGVRSIYFSISLLSFLLKDDQRYADSAEALDRIFPVLAIFVGDKGNKGPERDNAAEWLALTWDRKCDAMRLSDELEKAIAACSNGLDVIAALKPDQHWQLVGELHGMLSDLYSQRAKQFDESSNEAGAWREKAIAEKRDAIQVAYGDFKRQFDSDLKDVSRYPAAWRSKLNDVLAWADRTQKFRLQNWMEEEDFAFSLTRSDLIARRLYDLADLYETSHKLPEARVAYLMRISYRYGLASADDIDAKRQVVRKQIDDRLSKAAELKVKGDLAQAEAEEQAANERRSAQRQLLNYDHDGAKRLLARAVRDLGYLEGGLPHEGEASREQASAEQLFRSCATLLAGLADRESARPVNQREMSNCYAGLAWVERQRSATCNNKYVSEKIRAEGCSNQLEFLTSARDAYLKSIEYLERAFKQAASGETSDLTATLARVASLVEEMQRLQPTANDPDDRKKAIAEAATYRERAMGVAWTAYSACQSASVDHQCRNSGIVKDLAIRRNGYAWNLIRLGRIDEARGFLESAIQLNKEDPLKPRDFDELAAAINLAHTLLFNGEFERAKEIYLAVKDVSFNEPGLNNPSGFGNIKADFAEFKELGTVHPAMCRIGKLINDPEYAATTCAPR